MFDWVKKLFTKAPAPQVTAEPNVAPEPPAPPPIDPSELIAGLRARREELVELAARSESQPLRVKLHARREEVDDMLSALERAVARE